MKTGDRHSSLPTGAPALNGASLVAAGAVLGYLGGRSKLGKLALAATLGRAAWTYWRDRQQASSPAPSGPAGPSGPWIGAVALPEPTPAPLPKPVDPWTMPLRDLAAVSSVPMVSARPPSTPLIQPAMNLASLVATSPTSLFGRTEPEPEIAEKVVAPEPFAEPVIPMTPELAPEPELVMVEPEPVAQVEEEPRPVSEPIHWPVATMASGPAMSAGEELAAAFAQAVPTIAPEPMVAPVEQGHPVLTTIAGPATAPELSAAWLLGVAPMAGMERPRIAEGAAVPDEVVIPDLPMATLPMAAPAMHHEAPAELIAAFAKIDGAAPPRADDPTSRPPTSKGLLNRVLTGEIHPLEPPIRSPFVQAAPLPVPSAVPVAATSPSTTARLSAASRSWLNEELQAPKPVPFPPEAMAAVEAPPAPEPKRIVPRAPTAPLAENKPRSLLNWWK